jgi:preprotein translocase subunit SecD
MNRYPQWKNILIGLIVLIGLLYTIPNFYGDAPALQVSPAKATLKVDTALLSKVEAALQLAGVKYNRIFLEKNGVKIRFDSQEDQKKAKDKLVETMGKDYTVALNLLTKTPNWLLAIGAKPMNKGLDLQGGVHFLLQVDMKAALDKAAESSVGDFRTVFKTKKINYIGISRNAQKVEVKFDNTADLEKGLAILRSDYGDFTYNTSGSGKDQTITASIGDVTKKKIQDYALKQNLQTLHNRINELGVAEPIVQQQGFDRIVVQLPGVQDTAKAKELLGRTATLEIRMVDEEKKDIATLEAAEKGQAPFGDELYKNRDGQPILVKKSVVLTGDRITDAGPGVNQQTGGSIVNVTLDGRGAGIFKNVTRDNVGKRMAILLIEKGSTEVITAPVINEEIGGGHVQISGMANAQEATDISLLLRAGALAAPMEIIEERTVGPSMGADNIKRGVHSTLWGFAAIAAMMMIYYLVFGGVSVLALGVNLLLLVAALSMLQATLTLPGLAAIALALGMAIDANVLINERIREELRNGNTPQASIHAGYERAFDTILDSNVTTLIAGLALFMFGTGPIKGFAVVHVLGILTSMFSAILVSRAIVNLMYGYRRKIEKLAIGQIFKG